MRQDQVLSQRLRQKADFRLIAANQILQKGVGNLQQAIQEELSNNPALELQTEQLCPTCGFPLRKGECRFCSKLAFIAEGKESGDQLSIYTPLPKDKSSQGTRPEVSELEASISLAEHLRAQAQAALPTQDYPIADYLIANIDDKGLLQCELEEVAQELKRPLEKVGQVLSVLQGLDPLGVGARDPQEALLVQLSHLAVEQAVDPRAEEIIRTCWNDLANHRYEKIARKLHCEVKEVEKAVAFILNHLSPYPASGFLSRGQNPQESNVRWPDLVIHREKDDYRVEVVESFESELRISDAFLKLRQSLSGTLPRTGKEAAALESLRRACFFLSCLKMRKKTLEEVGRAVVRLQQGFLDTGLEEHLRPLTRAKVGSLLGKHESTISRAVADKFVLLPSQQLIPFEKFFARSAGPKSIIRDLIQREARNRTLTDQQIAQILASRGYPVARRTVTKYRLALRIPSSNQRRRRSIRK
jgi:RNA polymerase sigma-54 factor